MLKIFSLLTIILTIVLFPPAVLAYISQDAVPGDTTYPIKRKLEDGILLASGIHPTTRAWFSVTRSNRRFVESKKLFSKGKASTKNLKELLVQTNQAAKQIQQIKDPKQKAELVKKYQDSVKEYKEALKKEENQLIAKRGDQPAGGTNSPNPGETNPTTTSPAPAGSSPNPRPSPSASGRGAAPSPTSASTLSSPRPSPSLSASVRPTPTSATTRTVTPTPTPTPTLRPTPTPTPTPIPTPPGGGTTDPCPEPANGIITPEYIACISNGMDQFNYNSQTKDYSIVNNGSTRRPGRGGAASTGPILNTENLATLNKIKTDLESFNINQITIIKSTADQTLDASANCKNQRNRVLVYSDPVNAKVTDSLNQLKSSLTALDTLYEIIDQSRTSKLTKEIKSQISSLKSEVSSLQSNSQTSNQTFQAQIALFKGINIVQTCTNNPTSILNAFTASVDNITTNFTALDQKLLEYARTELAVVQ